MSKSYKLLLGIATFFPVFYIIVNIIFTLVVSTLDPYSYSPLLYSIPGLVSTIFMLHVMTVVVIAGLDIFYLLHLFKTNLVPRENKVMWLVALFLGSVISQPIYWYKFIWQDDSVSLFPESQPVQN